MARTGGAIPEKMKAVVKTEPGYGAVLQEVPVPAPGRGQVLARVKATAICGTDLHVYEWNKWAAGTVTELPRIMGHEFSGEVVAVGDGVEKVAPGDVIAGETHDPCGKCYQCLNGLQHICANMMPFSIASDGCFAEYALLSEICARPIPRGIPWEHGAMMEPLGTSIRSAIEVGSAGTKVLVAGAGPIGLGCVTALKALGAADIMVTDISDYRLGIAEQVGADICLNPSKDDVRAVVMERTGGVGTDGFIDASGNVAAIREGFQMLRKGGTVVLVGLPSEPLILDASPEVIFKEAHVIGIHGRRMFETWTAMENLMQKNLLALDPMVTHRLPLESFEEGFRLLEERKACKVILLPE